MSDDRLSDAVVAFAGVAGRLDPRSPDERVADLLGAAAPDLLPTVKEIVDEVYDADPPLYLLPSVVEMGTAVRTWLQDRHPELSGAAVEAIANRFTFDYR